MATPIRVLIRQKSGRSNLTLYHVDPITGKEQTRSAGTKDRREAERAAARWEAELLEHRGMDGAGWPYFRDRFVDEHLAEKGYPTRRSYKTAINNFERLIKVSSAQDITANVMSRFKALLLAEGYPPTTVHNYMNHMRVMLNWGETVGILNRAPKMVMPKLGKRKMMKGRPIDWDELQLMLKACETVLPAEDVAPFKRFLELLWYSGLRLQEAIAIGWTEGEIQIRLDGKPYPHVLFWMEAQKSREDGACPMPPDFFDWLSKTPPEQRTGRVAPLVNCRGQFRDWTKISAKISEIGKAAKVFVDVKGKPASAHDIRRAFGTRWASVVRPLTLQRMMRHATIQTTLKYYIGLTSADAGQELWGNSSAVSVPKNVPNEAVSGRSGGRINATKHA